MSQKIKNKRNFSKSNFKNAHKQYTKSYKEKIRIILDETSHRQKQTPQSRKNILVGINHKQF